MESEGGGIGGRWSKGTHFQFKANKYWGFNVQQGDYS